MDELERLKQLIGGVVSTPNSQPVTGNVNVNATKSNRPGGPLMADRVPALRGSKKILMSDEKNKMEKDLQKLLEVSGVNEAVDNRHIVNENIEKIVKIILGTAHMMDKDDRPGVKSPSKDNISVYVNFILEQVIDNITKQGYEVNWTEREWED